MIYVDSESVDQIGYDGDSQEAHVIFKKGGRHYIYSGVTPETFESLRHAPSIGGFVNQEFKQKGYSFREV